MARATTIPFPLREGGNYGKSMPAEREVRANGLSQEAGVGLLSEQVGLLKSCIDFQEVIKFLRSCSKPAWREHIN